MCEGAPGAMNGLRVARITWGVVVSGAIVVACDRSSSNAHLERQPVVVSTIPSANDHAVDPTTSSFRVVFSRDMSHDTFSFTCAGPRFPAVVGEPRWLSAKQISLPVRLQPGRSYCVGINSDSNSGFRDIDGTAVTPLQVRFSTRALDRTERLAANRAAVRALEMGLRERYSYRDRLAVDWAQRISKHRAALHDASDARTFGIEAVKLLQAAQDVHIWINVGGDVLATYEPQLLANEDDKTRRAALVPGSRHVHSSCIESAQVAEQIGYIRISSWQRHECSSLRPTFTAALSRVNAALGLVIDVRANQGGDETLAQWVAGHFVSQRVLYAQHAIRSSTRPSGFDAPVKRYVDRTANVARYRGRIAVLMGPRNMSSCEAFLLMMKQVSRATLVGARSYGASGNPKPLPLGNGVTVHLPSWRAMDAAGTPFEGVGIAPDVRVAVTPEQLKQTDPVLRHAVQLLARHSAAPARRR